MGAAPHGEDMVAIEVPADVAAALDARVESGEYSNKGDVVRSGLRLLTEEDQVVHDSDVEHWLGAVAVPIAESTSEDPARSIPADVVRARFAARRARRA